MGKSIVEIRSHTARSNQDTLFTVTIDAPEKHPASEDYFCRVTSSEGFGFRLDVYGITAQQAIRLALEMTTAKIANVLIQQGVDDSDNGEGDSDTRE